MSDWKRLLMALGFMGVLMGVVELGLDLEEPGSAASMKTVEISCGDKKFSMSMSCDANEGKTFTGCMVDGKKWLEVHVPYDCMVFVKN